MLKPVEWKSAMLGAALMGLVLVWGIAVVEFTRPPADPRPAWMIEDDAAALKVVGLGVGDWGAEYAYALVVETPSGESIKIGVDGSVELPEGLELDEASKKFWRTLGIALPNFQAAVCSQ